MAAGQAVERVFGATGFRHVPRTARVGGRPLRGSWMRGKGLVVAKAAIVGGAQLMRRTIRAPCAIHDMSQTRLETVSTIALEAELFVRLFRHHPRFNPMVQSVVPEFCFGRGRERFLKRIGFAQFQDPNPFFPNQSPKLDDGQNDRPNGVQRFGITQFGELIKVKR